jgi:hypothetical protein
MAVPANARFKIEQNDATLLWVLSRFDPPTVVDHACGALCHPGRGSRLDAGSDHPSAPAPAL